MEKQPAGLDLHRRETVKTQEKGKEKMGQGKLRAPFPGVWSEGHCAITTWATLNIPEFLVVLGQHFIFFYYFLGVV